ncbi:MAG TPA: class I adenylate-forming enzyme family protein [Xanthobacteraceae bacterium]|nr:class I adenylate-forming enzyme family protein [Xanthobacteraceae bacterium]
MTISDPVCANEAGPRLLRHWIDRAAVRHADKPFIISADDGRAINYARLRELTRRMAAFLQTQGIGINDRVALLSNNSIEHLVCYIGVMAYGATICTVHVEMNRNQLDNIFARLKPKVAVYEAGLGLDDLLAQVSAPRLMLGAASQPAVDTFFRAVQDCEPSEAHVDAKPTDDAVILFTSGTSEHPKGVVLSFRELIANVKPTADGFAMSEADRIYDFRSFNWCSAQTLSALPPLYCGATLILGRRFSRSRFFDTVRQYSATIATGNPTTINLLLNGDDNVTHVDVPSLRYITSSSAPLTVEEWRRFEGRFRIPVAQGYGSSETGWIAAATGDARRYGTVGRPLGYHALSIVDSEGRRLPSGEIGQVELGGFVDNDYRYLAEDGTVKVHSRGRIRTGDLGSLDADGFLRLTGREKELIIRGGAKISPAEIDSILMQRPEVLEAACIGIPDNVYGEEVIAYVVLRPDAKIGADDILRHCKAVLPAFKAPKKIVLSSALPKTERGKLDRKALVQSWCGQSRAS